MAEGWGGGSKYRQQNHVPLRRRHCDESTYAGTCDGGTGHFSLNRDACINGAGICGPLFRRGKDSGSSNMNEWTSLQSEQHASKNRHLRKMRHHKQTEKPLIVALKTSRRDFLIYSGGCAGVGVWITSAIEKNNHRNSMWLLFKDQIFCERII